MIVLLSLLSSLVSVILAELRQADLITKEEHTTLSAITNVDKVITEVVRVQWCKPPQVMSETADFLRKHGVEEESMLLASRQSRLSSVCMCLHVLCCTVEPPYGWPPCDIHYCLLIGVLN